MQTSFGINMLSIVDRQPKILPLHQMLELFLQHREEVVVRRTGYELRQAENRIHILEGLMTVQHIGSGATEAQPCPARWSI